jgi:hypothetical protein
VFLSIFRKDGPGSLLMVRQGCDYKGPSFGTAVPEAHSSFGPAVKEIIDGTARLRLKDLLSFQVSQKVKPV